MAKKKTLMIRAVGNRRALSSYRRMVIRNALRTMYDTNNFEQLWDAITILNNEFRKAKRDNFTRLCGGKGWK